MVLPEEVREGWNAAMRRDIESRLNAQRFSNPDDYAPCVHCQLYKPEHKAPCTYEPMTHEAYIAWCLRSVSL